MSKNFSQLKVKMSGEAQQKAALKTQQMLKGVLTANRRNFWTFIEQNNHSVYFKIKFLTRSSKSITVPLSLNIK